MEKIFKKIKISRCRKLEKWKERRMEKTSIDKIRQWRR